MTIVIPLAVSIFIFTTYFMLLKLNAFAFILPIPGNRIFGDLEIVTRSSACFVRKNGLDFFGQNCSDWGQDLNNYPSEPYNYPGSWARILALFRVTEEQTVSIGLVLIALFAIAYGLLTYLFRINNISNSSIIIIFLTSFSPATFLAIERANIDLFVFFIVVVAIYFKSVNKNLITAYLIAIASILKIYPLGALLIFFIELPKRIKPLFVSIFIVLIGLMSYVSEFKYIYARTPTTHPYSYGVSVIPLLISNKLEIEISAFSSRIVGIALVLFLILLVIGIKKVVIPIRYKIDWQNTIKKVYEDQITLSLMVMGTGVFAFSYMLGSNWEYRIIFLNITIIGLLRASYFPKNIQVTLISLCLIVVFNSVRNDGYQYVSDFILLIFIPVYLTWLLEMFRYSMSKNRNMQDN
jgi:hypothetical protein